jgi:hypothetical protein
MHFGSMGLVRHGDIISFYIEPKRIANKADSGRVCTFHAYKPQLIATRWNPLHAPETPETVQAVADTELKWKNCDDITFEKGKQVNSIGR